MKPSHGRSETKTANFSKQDLPLRIRLSACSPQLSPAGLGKVLVPTKPGPEPEVFETVFFFCSSADRERQGPVRNAAEAAKIEHLWLESGIISKTAASSSVSIEGAPAACLVGVLKSELRLPVRGQRGTDEANSDFLQLREPSLGFLPSPTVSVALQKDCERSDAYV